MDAEYADFVRQVGSFGTPLDDSQFRALHLFVSELLKWNRKINLTGAKDVRSAVFHVLDSLALLGHLGSGQRLIDLGSGAGFPAIPIKIARPDLQMVLVEARRKRASFLIHLAAKMDYPGIEVVWGRAEDKALRERFAHGFDTVTSRAAIRDEKILDASRHLLHREGRVILMKGPVPSGYEEEVSINGWRLLELVPYRLPGGDKDRNLAIIKRAA